MALKFSNSTSIKYHEIFDYKLTKEELLKWQYKKEKPSIKGVTSIKSKVRVEREKYSKPKLEIAKKAAKLISKIPTVKFVGITGSLAMMNSNRESDIDLMIITKMNTLWISRLSILLILLILRIPFRRSGVRDEKNKLCLNMWLDEADLIWNKKDRNIYTAHEIAQIVPLYNKDNTYEKFLHLNRWILEFWPNSVEIRNPKSEIRNKPVNSKFKILNIVSSFVLGASNFIAFWMQYIYMKPKITREVVTPTRAIFHPNDWGKVVIRKLSS